MKEFVLGFSYCSVIKKITVLKMLLYGKQQRSWKNVKIKGTNCWTVAEQKGVVV